MKTNHSSLDCIKRLNSHLIGQGLVFLRERLEARTREPFGNVLN